MDRKYDVHLTIDRVFLDEDPVDPDDSRTPTVINAC